MRQDQLSLALRFVSWGWKLLPQDRSKRPLLKDWPNKATDDKARIQAWVKKWPTCNFAVAAGARSGIIGLDVDSKNGQPGMQTLAQLEELHGELKTFRSRTPSDGRHLAFKYPKEGGSFKNGEIAGLPGIELKTTGGAFTLPGSIYDSGAEYILLDDREPAECPGWLVKLLQSNTYVKKAPKSGDIADGERNKTLISIAGGMRRQGNSEAAIIAALLIENKSRCNPALPDSDVQKIGESACRYDPADPLITTRRTDTGNASRFVHIHGNDVKYCAIHKSWFVWDGERWAKDETRKILLKGWQAVDQIYRIAGNIPDEVQRASFLKYVVGLDKLSKVKAMCEFASATPKVAIRPEAFDSDLWLLNCRNGTVELKTGIFREHRQADLITRVAPVEYDPEAKCPLWFKFLVRVMNDEPEMLYFLQALIGYTLTGVTREQAMFMLFGPGANGKSTFVDCIAMMMGDYAVETPVETILAKKEENAVSNDVARLANARLVYASEPEKNRSLGEGFVKKVTGSKKMSARFLYAESFDFSPKFKLFIDTNDKPKIRGTDYAIWRRMKLIPFSIEIPEKERDKDLLDKLSEELPGILNWAIEGCKIWQEDELQYPPQVTDATGQYKIESDLLGRFIDERCEMDKMFEIPTAALYTAYREWCDACGEKAQTKTAVGIALNSFQVSSGKRGGVRIWDGIKLAGMEN